MTNLPPGHYCDSEQGREDARETNGLSVRVAQLEEERGHLRAELAIEKRRDEFFRGLRAENLRLRLIITDAREASQLVETPEGPKVIVPYSFMRDSQEGGGK